MKKTGFTLLILFTGFYLLFLWVSDSADGPGVHEAQIHATSLGDEAEITVTDTIRVMTWNIAYGHGIGSDGVGYIPKDKTEYEERIQSMASLIRDSKADIVLIQEIDFHASRSHKMNQLHLLSSLTDLKYGAEAVSWDAGYVPFPYWPLRHQFGRTVSGGAVLSRFPIRDNEVMLHPKPETNPWYYNAFYLFRYSQTVTIIAGDRPFKVINNHLEAYNSENREEQAISLAALSTNDTGSDAPIIVIGGDMNTVPVQATRLSDFDDGYDDDYRGDRTMNILNNMPGFREIIPDSLYNSREEDFHTFPSTTPNRRLDYLFISDSLDVVNFRFFPTGDLSDHLPVMATIVWKP
ncbi:MAG: endonuclease/exonuclease/phosphatase family protein [Rhodothermaceae bacterium]|nr:endonuclease/exonuclease/phosphatase family protein [Rhodothermaceae bacterium]